MNSQMFGEPGVVKEAAKHFREVLGYDTAAPYIIEIRSPAERNNLICWGVFYYRPEYEHGALQLLIQHDQLKSVYKSKKHYYSYQGNDWYIAGYTTKTSLTRPYRQHHPFGHVVSLHPWKSKYPLDSNRYQWPLPHGTYPRLKLMLQEVE